VKGLSPKGLHSVDALEDTLRNREWGLAVVDSVSPYYCGEMAEWLKAHAWKACIPQGIQGSNPCLSAIIFFHSETEYGAVIDRRECLPASVPFPCHPKPP
jgi:hypothetical protein